MSKDHEDSTDNCIICLDEINYSNNKFVPSTDLLITACECRYNIHRSCFNQWLSARNSDTINCLVCASEGEIIITRKEKCKRRCSRVLSSNYFLGTIFWVGLMFCWILIVTYNSSGNTSRNTSQDDS